MSKFHFSVIKSSPANVSEASGFVSILVEWTSHAMRLYWIIDRWTFRRSPSEGSVPEFIGPVTSDSLRRHQYLSCQTFYSLTIHDTSDGDLINEQYYIFHFRSDQT